MATEDFRQFGNAMRFVFEATRNSNGTVVRIDRYQTPDSHYYAVETGVALPEELESHPFEMSHRRDVVETIRRSMSFDSRVYVRLVWSRGVYQVYTLPKRSV